MAAERRLRPPGRAWIAGLALVGAALAGGAIGRGHPLPTAAYASPDASATTASIDFFERRLAEDPGNMLFMSNLVGRYAKRFQLTAELADVVRAEELARQLLPRDLDPAAARARLASVLLARHGFAEAVNLAEETVAIDPRRPGGWAILFDAAFAAGRYDRAEDALARLTPGSVTRRLKAATWLAASGRTASARGELARACDRIATWSMPEAEAFCWTERAHLERLDGRESAARALYEQALVAVPGYRAAVEGFADLAHARGDLAEAESLYRRIAVDAHPDMYLRLAEIREAAGDRAAALRYEREFLRVATAAGAEPLYGRWLALLWAERAESRDAALAIALRDVQRRPAVESWDALAWVRFRRGELDEALAASDQAVGWGAPSPSIEYHRGRILDALGRSREAALSLEQATADVPRMEPRDRLDLAAWRKESDR